MRYLLDTRPFLLWISDSAKLPQRIVEAIRNPENSIYLSISSIREMQVKRQIARVDLPMPILDIVMDQNRKNGIEVLPISLAHVVGINNIPNYHGDPFDFLIIAQAMIEDMIIITNDPLVTQYPVKTWWGVD